MDIIQDFLSKIDSTKVLVIAGSMSEFIVFTELVLWINSQEGLYDGYEFFYYSRPESIMGIRFDSYIYYGTGTFRTDVDEQYIRTYIKS